MIEIASYLYTRRDAILSHWRMVCEQDPALGRIATFSREEFNNLLPLILDVLEDRLLGKASEVDIARTTKAHGLHRWHNAHPLGETMQELNYLAEALDNELNLFRELFPQHDATLLLRAHRQIAQVMSEAISGSVNKYDELQRLEAATRAANLDQALTRLNELAQQRGDILRSSTHDLRGSFGAITGAAHLLQMENLSDQDRQEYLEMLNRNLTNIRSMLNELMDLSRLEAGVEPVQIGKVDAARLLNEVVASAQPLAHNKGVVLRADGPHSLVVETDGIKLQRIIQNLVLNALKYTPAGIVSVAWSREGDHRWVFSIQDSGPGLPDSLTSVFAQLLRPTIDQTSTLGPDASQPVAIYPVDVPEVPLGEDLNKATQLPAKGEGVGLHIVKRLCELLNASMDVESRKGRGTLFRIRLPVRLEE